MERTKEPTILGEQSDDVWIGRKTTETARKMILNNLQLGSAMGIQVGNGSQSKRLLRNERRNSSMHRWTVWKAFKNAIASTA